MTVMKISHGRNKGDPASGIPPRTDVIAKLRNGLGDDHDVKPKAGAALAPGCRSGSKAVLRRRERAAANRVNIGANRRLNTLGPDHEIT